MADVILTTNCLQQWNTAPWQSPILTNDWQYEWISVSLTSWRLLAHSAKRLPMLSYPPQQSTHRRLAGECQEKHWRIDSNLNSIDNSKHNTTPEATHTLTLSMAVREIDLFCMSCLAKTRFTVTTSFVVNKFSKTAHFYLVHFQFSFIFWIICLLLWIQ